MRLPVGASARWWHEPGQQGRVRVVEAGPDDGRLPPLVLVHGLGAGARDFYPVLSELARERRVIAFDLPGFGQSDAEGVHTPMRYAALLHALIEETGHAKVALLGHSMGGAIALLYAGSHPERVAHLVLADVAGVLHREALVCDHVDRTFKPVGDDSAGLGYALTGSVRRLTRNMRKLAPDMARVHASGVLDAVPSASAAIGLIHFNFGEAILAVRAPTLLLWGGRDETASRRTAALLRDRLPTRNFAMLADAGHVPMRDAPARFVELVEQHLEDTKPVVEESNPRVTSERVGICRDENHVALQGEYSRIEIDGCHMAILRNVTVGKVVIRNSDVTFTRVRVRAGVVADDAELLITGGSIAGDVAIEVSRSYVDVAGTDMTGVKAAVFARGKSRLLFSVTPMTSSNGPRLLHGDVLLRPGQML